MRGFAMPKSHFRLFALLGGGIVLILALAGLWRVQNQPVNATWTPAHLALPLSTTSDRIEVLVADMPLQKAIADKRLLITTDTGLKPVLEATARVNNTDQILAARFTPLLVLSAVAGGAFVLFVIGLFAPRIGAFHQHGLIDLHLA
jgi:hypothetical protein